MFAWLLWSPASLQKPPDQASLNHSTASSHPHHQPLSSHSSSRFIRDHERQHDPPKGQQACAVSLSLVRHLIKPTTTSPLACLHPPSPTDNHPYASRHSSLHTYTASSPSPCLQSDPTKQSLTILVPPKTPLSTRPPSPLAHNSLVSPASKKVCATDFSPPPSLTNPLAQRTLPQYSLPTPPSSR